MKSKSKKDVIIAMDPSLTAFGYIIVSCRSGSVIKTGCIKTSPTDKKLRVRKGDDRCRRIQEVNKELLPLFRKYNVLLITSEQPHGSQSAVSAIMIGVVLGIIQTIADCKKVPIEWFSEGDCKRNLLGKKSASKKEVISAIDKRMEIKWYNIGYKDEAIADATAVYLCAKSSSPICTYLLNKK